MEAATRPTFARDQGFRREVKRHVDDYFATRSPLADGRTLTKAAIVLAWFVASYVFLVFVAATWWQAVLSSLSLGLATAAVGLNIQHDANHGALFQSRRANHWMGLTLDLLGASSYVWRAKHNVFHHTFTNVDGSDSDVDLGPLARLAPAQRRRFFHAGQHYYLWVLYAFLPPAWHFFHDVRCVVRGRIARQRFRRPRGWALMELTAGKLFFFGYAFVLPALLHPIWAVLLFYFITSVVAGLILSVSFQLAHCVEEAHFPEQPADGSSLPHPWTEHQVITSTDFARGSPVLRWYLGGLNFQIEHHLFPRVCHVHYPDIAPIVEKVCREFGVRYVAFNTLPNALKSHFRWLRRLGLPN